MQPFSLVLTFWSFTAFDGSSFTALKPSFETFFFFVTFVPFVAAVFVAVILTLFVYIMVTKAAVVIAIS